MPKPFSSTSSFISQKSSFELSSLLISLWWCLYLWSDWHTLDTLASGRDDSTCYMTQSMACTAIVCMFQLLLLVPNTYCSYVLLHCDSHVPLLLFFSFFSCPSYSYSYGKVHSPIIESVSEHKPTTWTSLFFDLHVLVCVFPAGLWFVMQYLTDERIFGKKQGWRRRFKRKEEGAEGWIERREKERERVKERVRDI